MLKLRIARGTQQHLLFLFASRLLFFDGIADLCAVLSVVWVFSGVLGD